MQAAMLPAGHVRARSRDSADDWAATCGVVASPPDALLQLLQEQLIVLVRCLQSCTTAEESHSLRTGELYVAGQGWQQTSTHMAHVEI